VRAYTLLRNIALSQATHPLKNEGIPNSLTVLSQSFPSIFRLKNLSHVAKFSKTLIKDHSSAFKAKALVNMVKGIKGHHSTFFCNLNHYPWLIFD